MMKAVCAADARMHSGAIGARAGFALLVLVVSVAYGIRAQYYDILSGASYQVGEWLINYGGGYVRRGMFGHLLLHVSPPGSSALWLLFAFQLGCYALMLFVFLQYLYRNSYNWHSIAVACGPAVLPFIGWDWAAGFKKEIIVFAALSLLILANDPARSRWQMRALLWMSLALFVLAVFSWEASILMLPGFTYLLLDDSHVRKADSLRLGTLAVATLVAVVGLGTAVAAHGNTGSPEGIYQAIESHRLLGPEFNRGGIESLAWTNAQVRKMLHEAYPVYLAVIPLAILAMLPIATHPWAARNWKWVLACIIGVLPLFFVALDYGRWIHVLMMQLSFCIINSREHWHGGTLWTGVPTVLYVSVWGVPLFLMPSDTSGPWAGLVGTLLRFSDTLVRRW